MQKQDVVDSVVAGLSSYLGSTMAEASTRMQWDKLGLGATVTEAEFESLLARLAGGLHVFVGREKTDRAIEEIRNAVKGGKR